MSEVKKLEAANVVCSNLRMYWGVEKPTNEHVNAAIVDQLTLEGCTSIRVSEIFNWQLITCDTDWISKEALKTGALQEIFTDAKGLPEFGENALRFEYFLYLLASDVIVFLNGQPNLVKGHFDLAVLRVITEKYSSSTCLCYKL